MPSRQLLSRKCQWLTPSGDERREEHAEHVPLDDLAAGLQIQTFAMHRQGRGVHHQDHQAVAGGGGQHRGANGRPRQQCLPTDC